MGKFNGGYGGGLGNMQNIMKQAQKMQADIMKKQEEVSLKEFTASSGGNAVVVKCGGDKVIKEIKLNKDVVDPDDIEMLEDLIVSAVNSALSKAEGAMQDGMGGFNIPGLM